MYGSSQNFFGSFWNHCQHTGAVQPSGVAKWKFQHPHPPLLKKNSVTTWQLFKQFSKILRLAIFGHLTTLIWRSEKKKNLVTLSENGNWRAYQINFRLHFDNSERMRTGELNAWKIQIPVLELPTTLNGREFQWLLQEIDGQLLLFHCGWRTRNFRTQKKLCSVYSGENEPRTCPDSTKQWISLDWNGRQTTNWTSSELEKSGVMGPAPLCIPCLSEPSTIGTFKTRLCTRNDVAHQSQHAQL